MPRLVLLTHYFSTHRGGVEIVARKLAEALSSHHNFHVTWISSATGPMPVDLPDKIHCVPVPACNISERLFGLPFPLWSPTSIVPMWRAIGRADLVHLHDYLYLGNLLGFVIARCRGIPVVVTQHIGQIPYNNRLLRWMLETLNRTLGCWVLSRARLTIFVSPVVRDYFASFCNFPQQPQYIANGINEDIFVPLAAETRMVLRRQFGYLPSTIVLLFVGRFVEKKGLPIMRHLAVRFKEEQFLFAGNGPMDPERWQLENVKVLRDRSGSDVAALYQLADLLVLPSCGEGFPLVIQESVACGTPVLTSTETAAGNPALSELLLTEAVDTAQAPLRWEYRIARLLHEPGLLREQREKIAARRPPQMTWQGMAARYAAAMGALR